MSDIDETADEILETYNEAIGENDPEAEWSAFLTGGESTEYRLECEYFDRHSLTALRESGYRVNYAALTDEEDPETALHIIDEGDDLSEF